MNANDAIESISATMQAISEAKVALYEEATVLATKHWDLHYKGNKGPGHEGKSILGVRVRKGKGDDFYSEWYRIHWARTKEGKYKPFSNTIRKGKQAHYPVSRLKALARDWELDSVLAVEDGLADIRLRMRALKKIEMALRQLAKVEAQIAAAHADDIEDGPEDDTAD